MRKFIRDVKFLYVTSVFVGLWSTAALSQWLATDWFILMSLFGGIAGLVMFGICIPNSRETERFAMAVCTSVMFAVFLFGLDAKAVEQNYFKLCWGLQTLLGCIVVQVFAAFVERYLPESAA